MSRRSFGAITRLPSKRYRARYTGPDTRWHNAPTTFEAKIDAEAWLVEERRRIDGGRWTPPSDRRAAAAQAEAARLSNTFARYADDWFAARVDLAPSTRASYSTSIAKHLKPAFGELPVTDITPTRAPLVQLIRRPNTNCQSPRLSGAVRHPSPSRGRRDHRTESLPGSRCSFDQGYAGAPSAVAG